jgi:DNA (cytosine-5)-methyltransferase 1
MARIIGEVEPRYVYVENSPMLTSRGLGTVLGDLASLGFDARWGVVSAAAVGAPHKRDRIWIVADSGEIGLGTSQTNKKLEGDKRSSIGALDSKWWVNEPGQTSREIERGMGRVADGVAARVDRLKAIGNGQVPAVAATAWRMLTDQ